MLSLESSKTVNMKKTVANQPDDLDFLLHLFSKKALELHSFNAHFSKTDVDVLNLEHSHKKRVFGGCNKCRPKSVI